MIRQLTVAPPQIPESFSNWPIMIRLNNGVAFTKQYELLYDIHL